MCPATSTLLVGACTGPKSLYTIDTPSMWYSGSTVGSGALFLSSTLAKISKGVEARFAEGAEDCSVIVPRF
jgi:hypothetical protein